MPEKLDNTAPNFRGHNVVSLDADEGRARRARLARLPPPVEALRASFHQAMAPKLKTYFERADDALFELADKASSNEEQNLYFDSMREVRVRRHSVETSYSNAVDSAFVRLTETTVEEVNAFDTLRADALSLVHDDDLETLVAIDAAVAKVNAEYGEPIQYISLRLDSLVPIKVYQKNNPVGPDVIASAFMAEIKKLDVGIKAKLVLFRLFEKWVMTQMRDDYHAFNQVLIDNNVLPSLQGNELRQSVRRSPSPSAPASRTSHTEPSAQGALQPEVASALSQFFGAAVINEHQLQMSHDELAAMQFVQLLNAAQRTVMQADQVQKGAEIRSLVASLRSRNSGTPMSASEDQVMNLVNMLFDFILDDRNLPEAMKVLISRMQIPIIKVALADKTFFTQKGHVARKLLNEMSTAAMGWQGDLSSASKDPLYRKIDEVVRTLVTSFDTDASIFNELLADFSAFLEKERRRVAVLERRTVDAEDGKARAEVARAAVARELAERCERYILPPTVHSLVHEAWSNVLFVAALKHGYESLEWQSLLKTLDELLWSVQAPADVDTRKKLIAMVPDLLKKLRAGLDTISYNPFEMAGLFKALEEVHLNCIRGKSPVELKPTAADAQTQHSPRSKAGELPPSPEVAVSAEAADSEAPLSSEPEPVVEESYRQQVASFVQGAWFDIKLNGDDMVRCRLAAFIKPTGKYIFVNRNGMKVAEKTATDLALLLQSQSMRVLDNSMLFDRALETIVAGLRDRRKRD